MAGFFDAGRPRQSNGRPQWLEGSSVLPHLTLDPQADGSWLVAVMRTEDGQGRWVIQRFEAEEIPNLLHAWVLDPEACLRRIFAAEPPRDSLAARADAEARIPQVQELSEEAAKMLDF